MKIIERTYGILKQKGLKASDLAKHIGVTTGQTTAWKQRETDPPAKYIYDIATFLNVSTDFLLTGRTQPALTRSETKKELCDTMQYILDNIDDENKLNQIKMFLNTYKK